MMNNIKKRANFAAVFLMITMVLAACSPAVVQGNDGSAPDAVEPTLEELVDDMMSEDSMSSDEMMSDDEMMDEEDMSADDMSDDGMMKDDDMSAHEDEDMEDQGDAMEKNEDEMMKEDTMDGEMDSEMDDASTMAPEWFNASLTNAHSGESFTIADFKGKVVLVETLAMWCSNCLKQQKEVRDLHQLLGERDDFISLGIDIDPNENTEALKGYIEDNGFTWHYTVAPVEVAREIGLLYGDQYLNPPSTPMLIIDRHGEVHTLPFGIKSADSLQEALQPFLNEGM